MKNLATRIYLEMVKILINDGARFIFATVTAMVNVDQLKTGNPLKNCEIRKRATYSLMLNGNYSRMINARREKEAEANGETAEKFDAKKAWFIKVYDNDNGSIVTHRNDAIIHSEPMLNKKGEQVFDVNGKAVTTDTFVAFNKENPRLYLFGIINPNPNNPTITHDYFIDGRVATPEEVMTIKNFEPEKSEPNSQKLEEPIFPITITLFDPEKHKGIEVVNCGGISTEFERVY